MGSVEDVVAFFRGPAWRTWLGHSALWAGAIVAGLGVAWLLTLAAATWLDLYLLAAGALAGWVWGGWHFGRREFGSSGHLWAAREARDWDRVGDSVMDFVAPALVATGLLYAIGRWVLGLL